MVAVQSIQEESQLGFFLRDSFLYLENLKTRNLDNITKEPSHDIFITVLAEAIQFFSGDQVYKMKERFPWLEDFIDKADSFFVAAKEAYEQSPLTMLTALRHYITLVKGVEFLDRIKVGLMPLLTPEGSSTEQLGDCINKKPAEATKICVKAWSLMFDDDNPNQTSPDVKYRWDAAVYFIESFTLVVTGRSTPDPFKNIDKVEHYHKETGSVSFGNTVAQLVDMNLNSSLQLKASEEQPRNL